MKKIFLTLFVIVISLMLLSSCDAISGIFGNGTPPDNTDTGTGEVDLSKLRFDNLTTEYNGMTKRISIRGTLPEGVTVVYEGNDQKNAGIYTVTAKFYKDGAYLEGKDMTATLTINRANYDMRGVSFPRATFEYTGETYFPAIDGILPEGVSVEYVYDGPIRNAGSYSVTASFTGDPNYEAISDMKAIYVVNQAKYDMSGIRFDPLSVEYDGNEHSIFISGTLPEGVSVEYNGNGKSEIGQYTVVAKFTSADPNYAAPEAMSAGLTILPEAVEAVELVFALRGDGTYEVVGYTGDNSHLIIPGTHEGKIVSSIKSSAFEGNENIVYAMIPASVKNIGNKAFAGCTSLKSITLAKGVEVIGYKAFSGVPITEIALPDTLTSIGQGAFADTALVSITLPFVGGSRVTSNAYLGYIFGATSYTGNAATVPTTLRSVTISDTAEEIPAYAFFGIEGITEIKIGKSVSFIGNSAFFGTSIDSIYLPASVRNIPADASAENSPFFGLGSDMLIVLEKTVTEGFGRYWNYTGVEMRAITVHMKTYSYYLENMETLRNSDPTSAVLSSILLNYSVIDGFSPDVYEYTATADINAGYPTVSAVADSAIARVTVEQANSTNNGVATITVVSADLSTTVTYTVTFEVTGSFKSKAEVVNKDGKNGAVTFVIDDAIEDTATLTLDFLNRYKNLKLTYAIITNRLATLSTETKDGVFTYVMSEGKYVYTLKSDKVSFWQNILQKSGGRAEFVSHTDSHAFWGTNDDGGVFKYVDSNGNLLTSNNLPKGSVSAEVLGSSQILRDLFGMKSTSHVIPGISVQTVDQVVNGVNIPTYYTYYRQLIETLIAADIITSARGTFGAQASIDAYARYVTTKDNIVSYSLPALMIRNTDSPSTWCDYIDKAEQMGGLAAFCIHKIVPDGTASSGHYVYKSMAEEMFRHACSKNIWIANYTEATYYFTEWASANVSAVYENEAVRVTLTDGEDNTVFDEPLTVKVSVPSTWTLARMNGETLTVQRDSKGNAFVYVNIVPDSGVQEITNK